MSQIFTSHPKAAVQGFLIWKTIVATSSFVTSPELLAILGGPSPTLQRWEICVESAGTMLSRLLEHYFVSATYPEQALQVADKMTTSIRTQFKKRISELDWMGDEAKKRAAKKVDNLRQNIGYPKSNPDVRSMESLATYYEGVNFTSSFFDNIVTGRQHTTAKVYAALAGPVDRSEFVGPSITIVNALYNQYANSMVIGAGISQLPIFHQDLPQYALYGGLGAVIGHELTHGFDSNGFKYDENAELRPWWDNATVANYLKRTECFVDQFSKYEVDVPGGKGKVNGNLTLAENLADAGGLRVAYDAWIEERKAMPNSWDQSLPGLDKFTHEQLFFVFFGNSWCNSKTPATALDLLRTDIHAPNGVRILGGAANSKAFRDAFKCKVREPTCEAF
jgi:endothelin-converting enzyme